MNVLDLRRRALLTGASGGGGVEKLWLIKDGVYNEQLGFTVNKTGTYTNYSFEQGYLHLYASRRTEELFSFKSANVVDVSGYSTVNVDMACSTAPSSRASEFAMLAFTSSRTVSEPSTKNVVFSYETRPFSRKIITEGIAVSRPFYLCAPMVLYHSTGLYDFSIYNIWLE